MLCNVRRKRSRICACVLLKKDVFNALKFLAETENKLLFLLLYSADTPLCHPQPSSKKKKEKVKQSKNGTYSSAQ